MSKQVYISADYSKDSGANYIVEDSDLYIEAQQVSLA